MTPSFSIQSIVTNNAVFLYDNGEKNMVATALRYGERMGTLENIDFRIIFFGS